jgi:hypothetical protein
MEAAPDFGGGNPPVPVYAPAPAAHGGHGVPPTAPGVVAAVPPPPAPSRGGSGGGKGLIIGLGVVGAGLLAAMAVIAAKSMKSDDGQTLDTTGLITDAGSGAATIAPLIDAGDTTTPVPTETSATPDADAATTATTPTSRPTSTSTKPATTSTGTATTPSGGGGAACDACIAAANAGNAPGAKANFDKCTDEAKKKKCLSAVNSSAAGAAISQARQGHCAQAKAIIAAAKQMGATSKKLDVALNDTSCK